jgi:hypothetical protein
LRLRAVADIQRGQEFPGSFPRLGVRPAGQHRQQGHVVGDVEEGVSAPTEL